MDMKNQTLVKRICSRDNQTQTIAIFEYYTSIIELTDLYHRRYVPLSMSVCPATNHGG